MYQRWQRSTPFHCTSKFEDQIFVSECLKLSQSHNRGSLIDRDLSVQKCHSEQSKVYDDDMEVDVNFNSPFSGPSPMAFRILKGSVGSGHQNSNESFDSDKAVFESSSGTKSFINAST